MSQHTRKHPSTNDSRINRTTTGLVFAWSLGLAAFASADDWPQWRGPTRDGVWKETGLVEKFDGPTTKPVWRMPIGSGYSGPSVAAGRVYITDRVVEPKQIERVHCFDAKTGAAVWSHTYDCPYRNVGYEAGPRASVLVHDGTAYSLGAMGNLFAFDAAKGSVLWQRDLNTDYKIEMPIWGISASPVIEGDLLITQIGGANGACVIALDRKTGVEKWRALDDPASYSAPIVIDHAGKRVLVVLTGKHLVGFDPPTSKVYWQHPFPPTQMVIQVATPVLHNGHLFVTSFFEGAMLVRLRPGEQAVDEIWRRKGKDEKTTDALHSIIATPFLSGNEIYGVDSYGELRCLDLKTGDRVWENLTAVPKARWATIHFVPNADKVWMFNERGELLIGKLARSGFTEISRTKIIQPTTPQLPQRGGVCWSHPAFADRHVFIRNDEELVCVDLRAR